MCESQLSVWVAAFTGSSFICIHVKHLLVPIWRKINTSCLNHWIHHLTERFQQEILSTMATFHLGSQVPSSWCLQVNIYWEIHTSGHFVLSFSSFVRIEPSWDSQQQTKRESLFQGLMQFLTIHVKPVGSSTACAFFSSEHRHLCVSTLLPQELPSFSFGQLWINTWRHRCLFQAQLNLVLFLKVIRQ